MDNRQVNQLVKPELLQTIRGIRMIHSSYLRMSHFSIDNRI